jgi:hypothetical protein
VFSIVINHNISNIRLKKKLCLQAIGSNQLDQNNQTNPSIPHMSCCSFAIDAATGKSVAITQVQRHGKRKRGTYVCYDADCRSAVFARLGDVKAHHFAHYSSQARTSCKGRSNGESAEHIICKHWVARNSEYLRFGKQECPQCNAVVYESLGAGWEAEVEARVAGCKRVVDVMLCKTDETGKILRVAVEIFHTHATDDDKYEELAEHGIKFCLEFQTKDILKFDENATAVCEVLTYNRTYQWCDSCILRERRAEATRLRQQRAAEACKKREEEAKIEQERGEAERKKRAEEQRKQRAEEAQIEQQIADAERRQRTEEAQIEQQIAETERKQRAEEQRKQRAEEAKIEQQRAEAEKKQRAEEQMRKQAEQAKLERLRYQEQGKKRAEQTKLERQRLEEKRKQCGKTYQDHVTRLRDKYKKEHREHKQAEYTDAMYQLNNALESNAAILHQASERVREHELAFRNVHKQGLSRISSSACKGCLGANWTHSLQMHEIKQNQFTPAEWDLAHAYHRGTRPSYVFFCHACSIQCSSCGEQAQLEKVKIRGMCEECWVSKTQRISHLQRRVEVLSIWNEENITPSEKSGSRGP